MSNWTFLVHFTSGSTAWDDITNLVLYDSIEKKEQLVGSGGVASKDSMSFTIKHESSATNKLFGADERIEFKAYATTTDYKFTGIIDNNFSQSMGTINGSIAFEAIDNSYKLDNEINTSFQYPSTVGGTPYSIFATSSTGTSILHALLTDAGYSSTQIGTTGSITQTIQHVAETAGERTYKDYIDALLPEYGYTYRFDEKGVFQTVSMRPTTAVSHTFGSSNIATNPPLTRDKVITDYQAVEVEWSELYARTNVYLYTDEADIEDGSWSGSLIGNTTNDYYPEDGDSREIYQQYDVKQKVIKPGPSIPDRW